MYEASLTDRRNLADLNTRNDNTTSVYVAEITHPICVHWRYPACTVFIFTEGPNFRDVIICKTILFIDNYGAGIQNKK